MACVARGMRVFGYDAFVPLVDFWQCLLKDGNQLADFIERNYYDKPITKERRLKLLKNLLKYQFPLKRASIFYAMNRINYGGMVSLKCGMGSFGSFTEKNINKLKTFKVRGLSVSLDDFHDSFKKHKKDFSYVDPPYLLKHDRQNLYGLNGELHEGFDHDGLMKILKKKKKWLLSYNDCPEIREMYKDFHQVFPEWTYRTGEDKKSREILIMSNDTQKQNEEYLAADVMDDERLLLYAF